MNAASTRAGRSFAWDDQQALLDELLLDIFAAPPSSASVKTGFTDSDSLFRDSDLESNAPSSRSSSSSVYASPASSKYDYDSSITQSSTQSSPAANHANLYPAFSPMKKANSNYSIGGSSFSTPGSPTASSSDESGTYMSSSANDDYGFGDLEMNASGSPVSAREKRQLEMRRKRNRESMRRVRQRKRIENSELKKLLPGLEARLNYLREMKLQQERQLATGVANAMVHNGNSNGGGGIVAAPDSNLERAMEQLRIVEDAFRRENTWLEQEIDKYEQAFVALQDEIDELRKADALTEAPPMDDPFAWTSRAIGYLPQFHNAAMFDFVRHSVIEVVHQVEAAHKLHETANEILGWRSRRTVTGSWIHFAVSKDFMHEDVEMVASKTWFVMSQSHTVNSTMPQNHNMKVLRVVNENTVICARNLFFPDDETNYCTIYLLMRVKTAKGYVIAQRSLLPADYNLLTQHLGSKYSYVNIFYGMILERHMVVNADGHPAFAPSGCKATFGGLAGNGTEIYVNTWAKDLFMAMLRWESACVGPLYRLL
ncbi:hypothetical protein Gpo141_00009714 [Globisporangium polare]